MGEEVNRTHEILKLKNIAVAKSVQAGSGWQGDRTEVAPGC